jgi:hypothetical protein
MKVFLYFQSLAVIYRVKQTIYAILPVNGQNQLFENEVQQHHVPSTLLFCCCMQQYCCGTVDAHQIH